MRIPANIRQSRHGVFYFRIVVPKGLRDLFEGRGELKRSLHTRVQRDALLQARRLTLTAYELFRMAEHMKQHPFDPNDPSTWPGAKDVAGKFEMTVEEDIATGKRTTRIKTDPNSPASIAAGKEAALALASSFSAIRAPRPEDEDKALNEEALLMAASEPAQSESGQSRRKPIDVSKLTANERKRLLSVLWSNYAAQQKNTNWTKPRTVADYNQKFETFLGWIGDRPIQTVTKEDYSNFKNWLITEYVPPKAKPGEKPGIDGRSVDKYTTAINGLFKWARNGGFFPDGLSLPTACQTIMTKKAIKARSKARTANRNFRDEELAIAFNAETYMAKNKLPHHFWAPLLALFSGARRAEVSQLLIRDIRQVDGIWVIDITDDDVTKNIKTGAGVRTIPIHPTLIEIGFLDYVDKVKAAKTGKALFPDVEANKHGEKGNAIGNAWRRYLIACGLRSKGQTENDPDTLTFHSLRHTAVTLLRNKGVAYDLRCQMVGHEAVGQQADYGDVATPAVLAEKVLPVFVYQGLGFSGLKYK